MSGFPGGKLAVFPTTSRRTGALIAWVLIAAFVMLGLWVALGGTRRPGGSR